MAALQFSEQEVHAAVLALYHDPSRADVANSYLLAFQTSEAAWSIGGALLSAPQPEVALFGACCLHQKAKSATLPVQQLQQQCEGLLMAIGQAGQGAVRTQLCLAAAALGGSLEAGPAALAQTASFAALPSQAQVELLATLPQACPSHHEKLRPALSQVMALLQHHSRADSPVDLTVASCCKSWLPLGLDLPDLSSGSLLAALTLGIRCPEPLCEVCAEVLCESMTVSSYPPSAQLQPLLQQLMAQLLLAAPSCLPPAAPDGASMALARVLTAAVSAAPDAAVAVCEGGAGASSIPQLMLRLCSLEDTRILEELAPAWAKLGDAESPPAELASVWRALAEVTLRQAAFPAGGDSSGRVFNWEEVTGELEEGEFVKLRRVTIFELWQCIALSISGHELLACISGALNTAASWRQARACGGSAAVRVARGPHI